MWYENIRTHSSKVTLLKISKTKNLKIIYSSKVEMGWEKVITTYEALSWKPES
jgi:hypothetical protein